MGVDTALALRVLAHELRSPTGVAQGYVRMLLEGRLESDDERQRALEQVRDVLGRIGQLSRQASETAGWLERHESLERQRVGARAVVDAAVSSVTGTNTFEYRCDLPASAAVTTTDLNALTAALACLIEATAREHPGELTEIGVGAVRSTYLELLAGNRSRLALLGEGPTAPHATPLIVERGGLGLTLVTAALVLSAHGATTWTVNDERGACGIRIPLDA